MGEFSQALGNGGAGGGGRLGSGKAPKETRTCLSSKLSLARPQLSGGKKKEKRKGREARTEKQHVLSVAAFHGARARGPLLLRAQSCITKVERPLRRNAQASGVEGRRLPSVGSLPLKQGCGSSSARRRDKQDPSLSLSADTEESSQLMEINKQAKLKQDKLTFQRLPFNNAPCAIKVM